MENSTAFSLVDLPIISQFMSIFMFLMKMIFNCLASFDVFSAVWCIVIFAITTKVIMLPSQISGFKRNRANSIVTNLINESKKDIKQDEMKFYNIKLAFDRLILNNKYGMTTGYGCLSFLLMFPVIIAMYNTVNRLHLFIPELSQMNTDELSSFYSLFGYDIREAPTSSILFVVPLTYVLLQVIQSIVINRLNGRNFSPTIVSSYFLTAYIAFRFATHLSLYWLAQCIFSFVVSIIFTLYYNSKNEEYFIEKSLKKTNRSRKRRGLEALTEPISIPSI